MTDRPLAIEVASYLDAGDIAVLTTAIERSLSDSEIHDATNGALDGDLRKALRLACARARLQRVQAEHLLIDVKRLWMAIPRVLSTRTDDRLNLIISACIEEYYAEEPEGHRAHPPR